MTRLRPFFSYYGSKWTLAPKYPTPQHGTIIEPFAGSACYSLLYPDRDVVLIERDDKVAGVWRYLIAASAEDVLSLPLLDPGESARDLPVCQEAQWLIGFWLRQAVSAPCVVMPDTAWSRRHPMSHWGERIRARIASQVDRIRHWRVIEGDYTDSPNVEAAWFVDPPYQGRAGSYYRQKFDRFDELAAWCRDRRGQVVVCENAGATWLPFEPLATIQTTSTPDGRRKTREAVWTNHARDEGGQALLPFGAQEPLI